MSSGTARSRSWSGTLQLSREVRFMDEVLTRIGETEGPVTYGRKEVADAIGLRGRGAILIVDDLSYGTGNNRQPLLRQAEAMRAGVLFFQGVSNQVNVSLRWVGSRGCSV